MKNKFILFLALFALFVQVKAYAASYSIDVEHSAVSFKVRHLFSKVQGQFNNFEGSFTYDANDPSTMSAMATIDVASIDTNVAKRDDHLRSPDFFNVEEYTQIRFESTGVESVEGNQIQLKGNLFLHGVEKEVVLDVEVHGEGMDPWGNTLIGLSASTEINRTEFGLSWNQALETGKLLIGEEVEILIEIEGSLQA